MKKYSEITVNNIGAISASLVMFIVIFLCIKMKVEDGWQILFIPTLFSVAMATVGIINDIKLRR